MFCFSGNSLDVYGCFGRFGSRLRGLSFLRLGEEPLLRKEFPERKLRGRTVKTYPEAWKKKIEECSESDIKLSLNR